MSEKGKANQNRRVLKLFYNVLYALPVALLLVGAIDAYQWRKRKAKGLH